MEGLRAATRGLIAKRGESEEGEEVEAEAEAAAAAAAVEVGIDICCIAGLGAFGPR